MGVEDNYSFVFSIFDILRMGIFEMNLLSRVLSQSDESFSQYSNSIQGESLARTSFREKFFSLAIFSNSVRSKIYRLLKSMKKLNFLYIPGQYFQMEGFLAYNFSTT